MKKAFFAILLSSVWVSGSEFLRNELLFKSYWLDHFSGLGLIFPSDLINGAIWGIWSIFMASMIFIFSRKFSLWKTTAISWISFFIMMWLVIGNLGVLPWRLLWIAVPWSILEVILATFISMKVAPPK